MGFVGPSNKLGSKQYDYTEQRDRFRSVKAWLGTRQDRK